AGGRSVTVRQNAFARWVKPRTATDARNVAPNALENTLVTSTLKNLSQSARSTAKTNRHTEGSVRRGGTSAPIRFPKDPRDADAGGAAPGRCGSTGPRAARFSPPDRESPSECDERCDGRAGRSGRIGQKPRETSNRRG